MRIRRSSLFFVVACTVLIWSTEASANWYLSFLENNTDGPIRIVKSSDCFEKPYPTEDPVVIVAGGTKWDGTGKGMPGQGNICIFVGSPSPETNSYERINFRADIYARHLDCRPAWGLGVTWYDIYNNQFYYGFYYDGDGSVGIKMDNSPKFIYGDASMMSGPANTWPPWPTCK